MTVSVQHRLETTVCSSRGYLLRSLNTWLLQDAEPCRSWWGTISTLEKERGEEHRAVSYSLCKKQAKLGVHAHTCTRTETSERTDKKCSRRMEA